MIVPFDHNVSNAPPKGRVDRTDCCQFGALSIYLEHVNYISFDERSLQYCVDVLNPDLNHVSLPLNPGIGIQAAVASCVLTSERQDACPIRYCILVKGKTALEARQVGSQFFDITGIRFIELAVSGRRPG